jgi:hypothetical protein
VKRIPLAIIRPAAGREWHPNSCDYPAGTLGNLADVLEAFENKE